MSTGRALATRYGALAGAIAGLTASALVAATYAYFAYGHPTPNADGALAGALLLSAVVGFPGSLAAFAVSERFAIDAATAIRLGAFVTPFLNWLALGAAAGLVVDAGRWLAGRSRRQR